jgi:hypothetical protein
LRFHADEAETLVRRSSEKRAGFLLGPGDLEKLEVLSRTEDKGIRVYRILALRQHLSATRESQCDYMD